MVLSIQGYKNAPKNFKEICAKIILLHTVFLLCFLSLIANQGHCMSKVNFLIPSSLLDAPYIPKYQEQLARKTCSLFVCLY